MQKHASFVTVTAIKQDKDRNGRDYKVIRVAPSDTVYISLPNGQLLEAKREVKETSFNAYKESYLNDLPQFGWNTTLGQVLLGDIVTREVIPYNIPTDMGEVRTVNTYSTFVTGDTTDAEAFDLQIKKVFNNKGRFFPGQEIEMRSFEAKAEERHIRNLEKEKEQATSMEGTEPLTQKEKELLGKK
jgi:hypothetical protein